MSNIVIKAENISKLYRLGEVGTGTISHDLNRWWARVRGKEDPYLMIGQENVRSRKGAAGNDYVWSLKDINFEIEEGEVIGIIGRNGAGKSTLLKLLSRITSPTTGEIKIKGRIASLLEVGTGFHPELTGRENIFLNGAIMGMTKSEIKSKLDEIVDFSGVDAYVDTPVKRYSSGMKVRLGFAVAAHLEPEILIVDEVLAVGDIEFQKKCIGKMKDVAGTGRTVLFVSHNMNAVNSLCSKCMHLKDGKIISEGITDKIVNEYLSSGTQNLNERIWVDDEQPGDEVARLHAARIIDKQGNLLEVVPKELEFGVQFEYEVLKPGFEPHPNIHILTSKGELACILIHDSIAELKEVGRHEAVVWIPKDVLNDGTYMVRVALDTLSPHIIHSEVKEALAFDVIEDLQLRKYKFGRYLSGVFRPSFDWTHEKIN